MTEIITELKNKHVGICFLSSFFNHGGVAAAEYVVLDRVEAFLKVSDCNHRTTFIKLDQIKQITILPTEEKQRREDD